MKTLAPPVNVIEVENDGLVSLLGKPVLLMCVNYIYTGILEGVNDTCVKLREPRIVYETGPWSEKGYKNAEKLPGEFWFVQCSAIESFGPGK